MDREFLGDSLIIAVKSFRSLVRAYKRELCEDLGGSSSTDSRKQFKRARLLCISDEAIRPSNGT